MFWPGMGDPTKRRKTLKFLLLTGVIAISVGIGSSLVQVQLDRDNPLKVCINDRDTPYRISVKLELFIDGGQVYIPANIGSEDGCQRTMYTLSDDGTIYAEWENEYPFEIGHFLWMWDFPLRDMNEDKSRMLVNGDLSEAFIRAPLVEGSVYLGEFTSKEFDESQDQDFLPPESQPGS